MKAKTKNIISTIAILISLIGFAVALILNARGIHLGWTIGASFGWAGLFVWFLTHLKLIIEY